MFKQKITGNKANMENASKVKKIPDSCFDASGCYRQGLKLFAVHDNSHLAVFLLFFLSLDC